MRYSRPVENFKTHIKCFYAQIYISTYPFDVFTPLIGILNVGSYKTYAPQDCFLQHSFPSELISILFVHAPNLIIIFDASLLTSPSSVCSQHSCPTNPVKIIKSGQDSHFLKTICCLLIVLRLKVEFLQWSRLHVIWSPVSSSAITTSLTHRDFLDNS